jgi:hypothetical protein
VETIIRDFKEKAQQAQSVPVRLTVQFSSCSDDLCINASCCWSEAILKAILISSNRSLKNSPVPSGRRESANMRPIFEFSGEIAEIADCFPLSSLEDGLPFLEERFAGFLGVLATEGDANIGQLVAELLFHVAGLERFHHTAF